VSFTSMLNVCSTCQEQDHRLYHSYMYSSICQEQGYTYPKDTCSIYHEQYCPLPGSYYFLPGTDVSSASKLHVIPARRRIATYLPATCVSTRSRIATYLPATCVSARRRIATYRPATCVSARSRIATYLPATCVSARRRIATWQLHVHLPGADCHPPGSYM
jgi:hypothetical protein